MKLFSFIFILIIVFVSVTEVFSQQLIINQEEKEEIISYLDSSDYRGAINTITDYKISEARGKIEQVFWNSKFDKLDQLNLLDLLYEFNSPYTHSYALAFIDSLDNLPPDYTGDLPSYLQAMTVGILVELGDNSKVNMFFDFVDEDSLNSSFATINLLPVIMEKVPEYEERAKNELIRFVKFSEYGNERYAALMPLYRRYGSEMLPLMLEVFAEDEDATNRAILLDTLIACCNSSELHSLVKERLKLDTNYYVRYKIMGKLLGIYGTPEDYKFVQDYLPNEVDFKVKEFAEDNLELFEPPKPDNNLTIENLINNTLVQTDTLFSFNWLGDQMFLDKLKSYLQSAKTNSQNGDSVACAVQIKAFQNLVDEVYKDSLNTDPRFVTIEGWKFLYWNAQYILDRLPEPPIEDFSSYSLIATHSLQLSLSSVVLSGDIGVNNAGLPPFLDSDVELSIGANVITPSGYKIKANRINVGLNAVVNGDVYYNQLTNISGTINGTQNSPLELPLFTSLPKFKIAAPGLEDIIVPIKGEHILPAGSYNNLEIKKSAKLILTGGIYHFNNFTSGLQSSIIYQAPSELRIANKLDISKDTNVLPSDTTVVNAKDLVIYVGGVNGTNAALDETPKAAVIGTSCKVKSNIYVPNGTLYIMQDSEIEGALIAKDLEIGSKVKVSLKSAF